MSDKPKDGERLFYDCLLFWYGMCAGGFLAYLFL